MVIAKRLLIYLLVGAVAGLLAGSFIGPSVVTFWNEPGAGEAMCNCSELARSVTAGLLRAQWISSAVGAVVFLIIGIVIERARASSGRRGPAGPPAESTGAAPPPTTPPADQV